MAMGRMGVADCPQSRQTNKHPIIRSFLVENLGVLILVEIQGGNNEIQGTAASDLQDVAHCERMRPSSVPGVNHAPHLVRESIESLWPTLGCEHFSGTADAG
jgi:hypothetical protein